jgi:hypothetical protein
MEFVRDDANQINNGGHKLRVFPSKGFIVPINKKNIVASGIASKDEVIDLPEDIRFTMDKQALTREQVMMLDIIANNDWKRPIYFSSPGGSDVSIALYTNGYVKQNGITYVFSPIRERNPIDKARMFNNLMNVYSYGKMNKKGVLSDYYTRRHTSQYRDHFASLADAYLNEIDELKSNKSIYPEQIKMLRGANRTKTADSLQRILDGADEKFASNKKKAIELVRKSLVVMPIENVIDYGEPSPSRENFEVSQGISYPGYTDGTLHQYIGTLYRAGDKKEANKVAAEVATQLESILTYFEKSEAKFTIENKSDLVAALNNYMLLSTFASDPEVGDAKSAVAQRMTMRINKLYKTIFPSVYSTLKSEGYLASEVSELKGHLDAVAMKYGFLAKPQQPSGTSGNSLTPQQIQQLMQEQ